MKIAISYPPLKSEKGIPLLGQNRQFQWFNNPTYIYPVIPAYTASLLKKHGYSVFWDDAIAEEIDYDTWLARIIEEKPDLIMFETKTPVVKRHWKIVNDLKKKCKWDVKIAMVGDHVSYDPIETLKNCDVDYCLKGGDYDFGILSLANHLSKKTELEPGWYLKSSKGIINTGEIQNYHSHDLDKLPMIDRELTRWKLYAYKNGNFKFTPGTYMMSGRDCWWGRCTFCSWTTIFPGKNFRVRSAKLALDEIGHLIDLGVREIMEDSGTLPIGKWLDEFCDGMVSRGYNQKVVMSCNMRINAITDLKIWKKMKQAGFRFILFGLESGNQKTLDRINKNLKVEQIEPGLKICKEAGLEPHITTMIGYPWETKADAQNTIDLAKRLFDRGYVDTLQATVLIPYPGTPLYADCKKNNLLNFQDYDRFDQREQVMKSVLSTDDVKELTSQLYKSFITPKFIMRKVLSIRKWDDVKFLVRAGFKVIGHLVDFGKN